MKNIENIIHLILSDYLNEIPTSLKNTLKPKNYYLVIRHTLGSIRYNLLKLIKTDIQRSRIYGQTWVIYESQNNFNALMFLKKYDNVFINPKVEFNYKFQILTQLRSIPILFYYLLKKRKLNFYFNYFYRLGLYEESIRYLKKYLPTKIIFSNDHNPKQRAFILAAKELGIKTYYFQHACVTKNFPPLEFSVAFLDGQDAIDKYSKIGINNCIIEKTGMIRAKILRDNKVLKKDIGSIGIAFNILDSVERIITLLSILRHKYPHLSLFLRPHPSFNDLDDKLTESLDKNDVILNLPKRFSPFEFLQKIDLLIAGNSSILLEAAIMNIIPISYNLGANSNIDFYGFKKNQLVASCKNKKELLKFIDSQIAQKSTKYHLKAAYYDESLKGEIDWRKILLKHEII